MDILTIEAKPKTREELIWDICAASPGVSRAKIAKALGMKKHKALHDLIEDMRRRDLLDRWEDENPNHSVTFRYIAKDKHGELIVS